MNRNVLKIIAAITMTFDHIAAIMINPPETILGMPISYTILRILGRIAFVLFAYMIAEGFFKTSNLKKYFLRLLFFALAIETFIVSYAVYAHDYFMVMKINVIWPLVFGLLALILIKKDNVFLKLSSLLVVILAGFLNIPYGSYGVLMIICFGIIRKPLFQFLAVIALNLIFIDWPLYTLLNISYQVRYHDYMRIQWFSILAFIFIFLYNGQKGKINTKWFFYIFYPLHLGIIYILNYIIK